MRLSDALRLNSKIEFLCTFTAFEHMFLARKLKKHFDKERLVRSG